MTAHLGWLDRDDSQRAKMLELVKLFQDTGSVDELGIGPVRDAFSNAFFPGTSVLHTRVRYLLFIPWLCAGVARQGRPLDEARTELRRDEVKLIRSLIAGGESTGVIGSQRQDKLKTMPSEVYWPALGTLGVRRWNAGVSGHLRAASQRSRQAAESAEGDQTHRIDLGFTALPSPPDDLLTSTTFDLTEPEAGALREIFLRLPPVSLLHWFAGHAREVGGTYVWQHPQLPEMPAEHRARIDQARRLHHAWHGAPLLYNLMLARQHEDDERVAAYEERTEAWLSDVNRERVFDAWSHDEFWALVRTLNPRLSTATSQFVGRWLELAEAGQAHSAAAQRLITERERRLKGRRARLTQPDAPVWSGGAGLARLGYRWNIAQRFLRDILDATGTEIHTQDEPARELAI